MKELIVLILLTSFLLSCNKEDAIPKVKVESKLECFKGELEIITDEGCCDIDSNFLTCEILEVEGINTIDEQSFSWLPNACSGPDSEITFTSSLGETKFTLLDRDHYILYEALRVSCNENYERSTFIKQKSEIIRLAFQNELFGQDTLYLELRSIISAYESQTPTPKIDRYSILHHRSNTNIANFYVIHRIGDSGFDFPSKTFHEAIELNGKEYYSVVEFKIRSNAHATPHTRIYINDEFGFFGFEVNQMVWTKK